jgi:ATP-dependent protease ClpP protease subunit
MTDTTESKTLVKLTILGEITKKTYIQFEDALNKMQEQGQDRLPIIINSVGGLEDMAIMIATRMLAEPEKFVTYAPVQACSAASYVFLAAGERILGEMGHLLFHQTSLTDVTMSITKLKDNLDECQTRDAVMAKELASHIGLPSEKYRDLVHFGKDENTRIWKDVALEHGFCTSVGTAVFSLNEHGNLITKIALPREEIVLVDAEELVETQETKPVEPVEPVEPAVAKTVTQTQAPVKENKTATAVSKPLARPLTSAFSSGASNPAAKKPRTAPVKPLTSTTSKPKKL